jgi:hypothetical protein
MYFLIKLVLQSRKMSVEDKLNYRLEIIHFKQTDGRKNWQLYAPTQNISGSIIMRYSWRFRFRFIVLNATFNNISAILWQSVLLVEESGGPGEKHRERPGKSWRLKVATCDMSDVLHQYHVSGIEYAIRAYHHWSCEVESRSRRGVQVTTFCYKVCQWLATGRCFHPGILVSYTNKSDRHDIIEILLKPNPTQPVKNWILYTNSTKYFYWLYLRNFSLRSLISLDIMTDLKKSS